MLPHPGLCHHAARIVLVLIGLAVLATVINLLRTRRLKEEYALLWLAAALALVAAPILIDPLDQIAFFLNVDYPPALYLGLAVVGLLLILFQLSLNISRFSDHIRVLTQEIASCASGYRPWKSVSTDHDPD